VFAFGLRNTLSRKGQWKKEFQMKKLFFLAVVVIAGLMLNGCATKVQIPMSHPPIVDMHGIRKITVLPINRYAPISGTITQAMKDLIVQTNFYTLIDSSSLNGYSRNEWSTIVDAYIETRVGEISSSDTREPYKTTDAKGNSITRIRYIRTVKLQFAYQFVKTSNNQIFKVSDISGSTSDSNSDRASLDSPQTLAHEIIYSQLKNIQREIAPWQSIEKVAIQKDPTKDKRLKNAQQLVKDKRYQQALEIYIYVYEGNENLIAGYNAALLMQALGKLEDAINLLEKIIKNNDTKLSTKQSLNFQTTLNKMKEQKTIKALLQNYK
jgi:hypothetical protein